MLTFVMFSLFYRELKEALVLMVLLGKRAEKESKVVLHICTEEDRSTGIIGIYNIFTGEKGPRMDLPGTAGFQGELGLPGDPGNNCDFATFLQSVHKI